MENLFVQNAGLDHLYINGIPIVECDINMSEVYAEVRRITNLAVLTDPYLLKLPLEVRKIIQLQGDERIAYDMIKRGAGDMLPVFQCKQRLIPEGIFKSKYLSYTSEGVSADHTWEANDDTVLVKDVRMTRVSGSGIIKAYVNDTLLNDFTIDEGTTTGKEDLVGANQYVSEIYLKYESVANDLYLPGVEELAEINFVLFSNGNGNIYSSCYWSSRDSSEYDAYCYDFSSGSFLEISKDVESDIKLVLQVPTEDAHTVGEELSYGGIDFWIWKIEDGTTYLITNENYNGDWDYANGLADTLYEALVYNLEVSTVEYDGYTWKQALIGAGEVQYPREEDLLSIYNLTVGYSWNNVNDLDVYGITCKNVDGRGTVTVSVNGTVMGSSVVLSNKGERNDNLIGATSRVANVDIEVTDATSDFKYNLIFDVGYGIKLPSPRYEFDSEWREGKIYYRYQNMDTRVNRLDYTSNSNQDVVVDSNNFDNVKKYAFDALVSYMLKELYKTVGYGAKYQEYNKDYTNNRREVAYWLKNTKLIGGYNGR